MLTGRYISLTVGSRKKRASGSLEAKARAKFSNLAGSFQSFGFLCSSSNLLIIERVEFMFRFLASLMLLLFGLFGVCLAQSSNAPMPFQGLGVSRTQIAFAYAGSVWVIDRAGGAARRLTSVSRAGLLKERERQY
jgi:hypothetical protein